MSAFAVLAASAWTRWMISMSDWAKPSFLLITKSDTSLIRTALSKVIWDRTWRACVDNLRKLDKLDNDTKSCDILNRLRMNFDTDFLPERYGYSSRREIGNVKR